ncbi:MAG: FAD binding domain-containing protein [Deltaproteobacteria bacterium]|jgi:xanthine dehydrogenase small subunit|nr:FAD binding domain-containing protein [Deltaproteobacteria bacterium]MBW2534792.1 FAD binding domain-containing protein [Deltaproteobacteria bacterium]
MVDRYLRPTSPAEAVRLKKETGGVYLAGGTELNWRGAPAADTLISLEGLALDFIRVEEEALVLGPTVTLQALADSAEIEAAGLEVLQKAALGIGSRPIRSLATLGGNLASNKSCSDMIPALWVLDTRLTLSSREGDREVAIGEHVMAHDAHALIAAIRVPRPAAQTKVAIERYSRSATDLALINAAVAVDLDGATVRESRVALGGVAATVVRVAEAETALSGADLSDGLDAAIDALRQAVASAIHPIDDLRGSAAYKTEIAAELCGRALAACARGERS